MEEYEREKERKRIREKERKREREKERKREREKEREKKRSPPVVNSTHLESKL
jgi:hypothetical protein